MIAPLAQAVRDELRKGLRPYNIPEDSVEVRPDGKAYAADGQVSVSIYSIDITPAEVSGNAILSVDSLIGVGVTVKGREVPVDRRGTDLYTDIGETTTISVEEIVMRAIRIIHGQFTLIQKANRLAERFGIVYSEPLFLARSIGQPEEKGPEHWNIQDNGSLQVADYNEDDLEGYYLEAVFQGAKCFQPALDFESTF